MLNEIDSLLRTIDLPTARVVEIREELERAGKGLAIGLARDQVGKLALKAVDAVVAAVVRVAPAGSLSKANVAGTNLVASFDEQLRQLGVALRRYVPLAVAVEVAKKEHGPGSPQAGAARVARQVGIEAVRSEVGDAFAALIGGHVED